VIKTKKSNKFDNKPYARRVEKPWGFEIHWVRVGMPYMGKILHIKHGHRFSLQYHDVKQESWFIKNGRAKIIWDNGWGKLVSVEMKMGKGYTCDIGQKHRIWAISDCDIIEISTPEVGTTFRLSDDYARNYNETEDIRKSERKSHFAKASRDKDKRK
jgi:mannose-6-phosphate isomerase